MANSTSAGNEELAGSKDTISTEPSPESLLIGCFMFVQGDYGHSENLHLIHNTAFANRAN